MGAEKKRNVQIVDGLAESYESGAGPCQMVRWIKQDERDHVSQLPFRSR